MGTPDAEGHGPPEGLPDLPPEWGRVVVPDDPSALAGEAAQVRREMRRAARGGAGRPALGLPLVVLLVAVLTTLAGLVAVTWPRTTRSADRPAPAPAPYDPPAAVIGRPLPALDLVDGGQSPVPLRGLLPAVILLVDGCGCPERVAEAVAAAPAAVTVVTVTHGPAAPVTVPPGARAVRALGDPTDGLRTFLRLPARPNHLGAVLVDRAGVVVGVVPDLGPVETYRADLARLAA
ncbi:hypothetical protein ACFOOK_19555 [Micromonospora krabiensis]|uniref:Thioredoxin domain-containing protein n=1 Tax=Micromonospora krabiensis TaxID=307121 RepID=A0A1C3N9I6_9ACTN|nr:hypothetical protein [Micromonospora krabiensis]SBV29230.1 hypothetical protein GA0070620_4800 [Micromonospora krabiensis]